MMSGGGNGIEIRALSQHGRITMNRCGCEAPSAMAEPVRTHQVNQVIRHPRTTFGAAIVDVNKRSVSAESRAFTLKYLRTRWRSI